MGIVATVVFIAFEAMAVATAMPKAIPALNGMPLYALAFSGFFTTSLFGMVLAGDVCDRRGPRLPLLAGTASFTAGLLIAGTAQAMWPFVLGRAVQGLGGGIVIVAVYVVVGRAYDDDLRPRMFAALSAAWVVPSIVGPLVAGVVADHLTWRLVFLGIAPLAAVAVALAIVAVALLVPSVPRLLPSGTLRLRRGLPTVVAMRGIMAGAFFGAEAFVPLMLVQQRGLSTTMAGLALTGGALGWATGSWYQGRPRLRIARHLLVRAGAVLVAVGIVGTGLVLVPGVPAVAAGAAWAIGGVGMGLAMASIGVLLFELSPVSDQGANSASLQLSDSLFSITFIGLAGVIFGSSHRAAGEVSPAVYATILTVMVALALIGVWAAGRVRRESTIPL